MRPIALYSDEPILSGYDKSVTSLEKEHLPPAKREETSLGVKLLLFGEKDFGEYPSEEKLQAAYEHTVLCHLSYKKATNQSLRERFGLGMKAKYRISRIYAMAIEQGKIKKEADSGKADASYLPYWERFQSAQRTLIRCRVTVLGAFITGSCPNGFDCGGFAR